MNPYAVQKFNSLTSLVLAFLFNRFTNNHRYVDRTWGGHAGGRRRGHGHDLAKQEKRLRKIAQASQRQNRGV